MHGGVVKAEEAVVGPVEGGVGSHHLPSGEVAMRSFIAVTVLTLLLVAAVIGSFVCTKDSLQVRRSRYDATRHGVRKVNIPSPGKRYNLVQPLSAITTTVQQSMPPSDSAPSCACTGVRSCSLCEGAATRILKPNAHHLRHRFLPDGVLETAKSDSPPPGLLVVQDAITEADEADLLRDIYARPWKPSQSGRRKQDYGPQVNFKRRKLKCPDAFRGLPHSIDAVLPRVNCALGLPLDHPWHEMVVLEYTAHRGSNIDLHQDHSWVWGDGILDLSLASDCVMTFANPKEGVYCDVHLPRRSACLISGPAQTEWLHGIRKECACLAAAAAAADTRVSVTLRVLTAAMALTEEGQETVRRSLNIGGMGLPSANTVRWMHARTCGSAASLTASVNLAYLSIMNDGFEFDPDMALVVKVAPEDQLDLTPEELEKEVPPRVLHPHDPHAPDNMTQFSFKDRVYKPDNQVDHTAWHLAVDG
ncbi:alkB, alkylation repair 4, partial [Perkinsus olseni]